MTTKTMNNDAKINWKTVCEKILIAHGFKPWWEIPERVQRVKTGIHSPPHPGFYRCSYYLGPIRANLVISKLPDDAEPVRWGLVDKFGRLARGRHSETLLLALDLHCKNDDKD